ncbi:hypothetical protein LTR78_000166 [Recurvomyces mirabilis]|uniref:Uncharacterized protein n=1 Tax=Recurvomyces mirabilis TaxID=574656 RepID=A0AAE1C676_9PEZI|nr:hypothetical protein LTR78_000166 [Recurvomyces mirabilis]KAK5161823.1 hypothetical protein LTS14_000168 [Recurvomyces mirabilis]
MLSRRATFLRHGTQLSKQLVRHSGTEATTAASVSRIARIESRLPRFLRHFTTPLRNAPVSHISAFLVLHELTAILPLFGLAAIFHYTNWLPPYISEGKWVSQGIEKFGRYLRKKGWISTEEEAGASGKWWGRSEGGVRIVVELATAYAITKALLPLRLILSMWGTPWFAKWTVLPFTAAVQRVWQSRTVGTAARSPAAGTGAVGAGVLPKEISSRTK